MSHFAPLSDTARRRAITFLNLAHAIDHFVLLIFPTIVIGLEVVFHRPYSEMIALSTAMFVAFGLFSLPAGWLADRWSRRSMMALFYFGCGVSLVAAAFAPTPFLLAAALFVLGMFAAIYHPVGMAMLIDVSDARGRTLAFNGVCGNLGVALAAGISATLAAWFGWRAAFFAPAVLCFIAGFAFLALVADDRHHTGKRKTTAQVTLTTRYQPLMTPRWYWRTFERFSGAEVHDTILDELKRANQLIWLQCVLGKARRRMPGGQQQVTRQEGHG